MKGPVLLASNHPNSFLDSVVLDTLFKQPVWSLARGDAFKKPFYIKLLNALKILPVYRTSEGVENLSENYKTFEDCIKIFKNKGVICIFSEGKCINEWHLRPLKKGTARLAIKAWEENIPLDVLPVGINYSSFQRFGKTIFLNFGEIIRKEDINLNDPDGLRHQSFNHKLKHQLEQLVFEIPEHDKKKLAKVFQANVPLLKKILLSIPAVIGFIAHLPLFLPAKFFTREKTSDTDHYDSVLTAILLLTYPLYIILVAAISYIITKNWYAGSLLIILPFTAGACVQLKSQLDK